MEGDCGYMVTMTSAGRPTLPGRDYHARDVFELEREKVFFREWFYAGRADHAPEPGDFLTADVVGELCARVVAAGSSAYAVDVTAPDVAELGLVVTKVVAPELCSLDVAHGARFLGGRRLYEAAAELGLRAAPLTEADLNPYPHPFP